MSSATVYSSDPVAAGARSSAEDGAEWLHVVDLDGADGGHVPQPRADRGGDRRLSRARPGRRRHPRRAAIRNWVEAGAKRVVLGTAALKDPDLVIGAAQDLPGQIVVAVDARDGMITTEGWAETSDMPVDRPRPPVRGCGRRRRCCSPMSAATAS